MKIYDQQTQDPSGFKLSLAAIAGLVAVGGVLTGGAGGFAIAMLAGSAALWFFLNARD